MCVIVTDFTHIYLQAKKYRRIKKQLILINCPFCIISISINVQKLYILNITLPNHTNYVQKYQILNINQSVLSKIILIN